LPLAAIDQENVIESQEKQKKFEQKYRTNGDILKKLLTRSRYFLYKNKSKWSKKTK
jgi:hypothetical protein